MAILMTDDISRMLSVGQKEIFTKNLDAYPIEYPEFVTFKTSDKKSETYDSVGNLPQGGQLVEGDSIVYGKVKQAHQTTITNLMWSNGYSHTFLAAKFDLYKVVNDVRAKELARTMRQMEEERAIKRFDEAFATNLADGVPLCSNSKPLVDVTDTYNDTLATASSLTNPANHKTMMNMFYDFKNHQGGKIKSRATDGLTHYQNQFDIEEIYSSVNTAKEISNTKNVLPKIMWHYSTYLSDTNAWFMWDKNFEHVLFQWHTKTLFNTDQDKINTLSFFFNAEAIYETGTLPNIGIIGNQGA